MSNSTRSVIPATVIAALLVVWLAPVATPQTPSARPTQTTGKLPWLAGCC
jgi:hypothetical protein